MAGTQPLISLQQKLQGFLTSSGLTDAEYNLPAIIERYGSAGYHIANSFLYTIQMLRIL